MGQKQSKQKNKKNHSKNTMIRKMDGSKLSASSLGNGPDTLGLTIAPAGDDELSAGEEGHANLLVPKRSNNICGVFLQTLVIMAPIDDCIERDLGIFELFNYDEPEDKMWAYIARPEVSKENAIESFKALCQVLNVVPPAHKNHFPKHHVSGKLKRLVYGMDSYQSVEHDPEWIGRLAMIVSLPSNGVFLSSVLAFSPTGTVWTWLALLIGLGMVNALKALHEMGFVHRYVTPWNFLLQIPFEMETIQHGILHADLSLAARWPMKKMQLATPFVGTIKYSSKRALTRHNQGPADDFISVIYIVAELISGKLPWRAIKNIDECAIMKQKFPQSIQYKRLPRELRVIYQMLYRTYGLKKADSEAVTTAFKKALYRRAADWDTRDFPDWLSMPPDDAD